MRASATGEKGLEVGRASLSSVLCVERWAGVIDGVETGIRITIAEMTEVNRIEARAHELKTFKVLSAVMLLIWTNVDIKRSNNPIINRRSPSEQYALNIDVPLL